MKHSEIDVKFLWNLISDFWNHFEDKEVISQIWRTFLQAMSNIYYQLYQISLSKSVETIPDTWITDWEPVTLDKSTAIKVDDLIIYYKDVEDEETGEIETIPVTFKEIDWSDPTLIFTKRNPKGVIRYDDSLKQWYVNDIYGTSHYRDFPNEYTLPPGLKNATYLVETPRNGVKFSQKAYSSDGRAITYSNGYVRPFETEHLTDQHGFTTDFVANGVLASGEPGTQDFLVLPTGDSTISRICTKVKINTRMWAHVGLRQSYNLYESFGYLLRFFKPDGVKYLREIQGLWLSYLSSPTISALQRGFTVLRDLPFALQSGVITNLEQTPTKLIITHAQPLYLMQPGEINTEDDPRNCTYNPHDYAKLTDKPIYEKDGSLRDPVENPEIEAKPFVEQALGVGDYIYCLDDLNQIATFSFVNMEKKVDFPPRLFNFTNDLTVLNSYILGNRYCIRLRDRILSTFVAFNLPEPGTVLKVDDYDRIVNTPFAKTDLEPLECKDIITDIVKDGSESYLEVNYNTRFSITEYEAQRLIDENIKDLTILYINGAEVTVGSLANVKLDTDTYRLLFEQDYISFISPAVLDIEIDGTNYTYHTDSTLEVSYGQYIEKYDPIVHTVTFKDYITHPNWIFEEIGNVNVTNAKSLETILDMWHSFLVEVDEYSVPDTFETSRLINNFIKAAKPTYVNYRMVANFLFEDTLVMSDEFDRGPRYEFIFEYPWAGRGLLIFDNECHFDDYYFDDDQRFEDSDFADPMWVWPVRDTWKFEDNFFNPMCLDDGMLADGTYIFDQDSDREEFAIAEYTPDSDAEDTLFAQTCYDNTMRFDNGNIFDLSYDEVVVLQEH